MPDEARTFEWMVFLDNLAFIAEGQKYEPEDADKVMGTESQKMELCWKKELTKQVHFLLG